MFKGSKLVRAFPAWGFSRFATSSDVLAKTSLQVNIHRSYDKPGAAADILGILKSNRLNLTHLDGKLHCFSFEGASIEMDVQCHQEDPRMQKAIREIGQLSPNREVSVVFSKPKTVPWFPLTLKDLQMLKFPPKGKESQAAEAEKLPENHPGFSDETYVHRRKIIGDMSRSYSIGDRIPRVDYTEEENKVWKLLMDKLAKFHNKHACQEFLAVVGEMERAMSFRSGGIPQLQDVSEFLQAKSGFKLMPVSGLLSARDFLNALAFRTFCCTQYIRHGANPLYTPEPDICHELMGHVPLFADVNFAEFSQKVGLASLGASDEDIARLASIYWFTVEFGLVWEEGKVKAMGAGLLSSFGELEWACDESPGIECRRMGGLLEEGSAHVDLMKPRKLPFDPKVVANVSYPVTTFQPVYFVGESVEEVKRKTNEFCDHSIFKPFHPVYCPYTCSVSPTRKVVMNPRG